MTSEIEDKKKFEFEDIALKNIQTHFRTICRAFFTVCGLITGRW